MVRLFRLFTRSILINETRTVTLAAIILAASSLCADILGLLRDRMLAAQFGAGRELDIYNAAFRIPDFLFLVLFGAISAAFLPVFSHFREKNPKEAWQLTNNLLSLSILLLSGIATGAFLLMPKLVPLITGGFSVPEQELTIRLSRFLLLSPIFFGVSSFMSGILHYFKKFLLFSLAPILYNFGIIIGVIFFYPRFGFLGLGLGVILGAFMYLVIQIPGVMVAGFIPKISLLPMHEGVYETFILLLPRIPNLVLTNINILAITAIASSLAAGSLAIFTFADNLRAVPVGIFGISFATAVFPNLSKAWATKDKANFSAMLSSVIKQVSFVVLPILVLFIILRAQIIRVVLGAGKFDWEDTQLTAAALGLFAVGILAQALIPIIMRAFFAIKDTMTPLVINSFSIILNIAMALFFVSFLKSGAFHEAAIFRDILNLNGLSDLSVLALPASFSLASIVQLILLVSALRLRLGPFMDREAVFSIFKMFLASLAAALAAYTSLRPLAFIFDLERFFGIFAQGLIAGLVGSAVYILLSLVLGIREIDLFFSSLRKQFVPQTLPSKNQNPMPPETK